MKKFLMCMVMIICIFSVQANASANPLKIKIGHGVPETATLHQAFVKFKELVEKDSQGSIIVEIFPNQQLGGDRELIEALQMNNVSITAVSGNNIAPFVPQFFVFDLFFLFDNREHAYAVLDGPVGKELFTYLEPAGLKGLGQMENGFRNLTNSKRAIRTPSDLTGIKIRVAENPVQIAAWKAAGANPTPMAWGEIFTALQQKALDGQETSLELIFSNRFYEAQKFLSLTEHLYTPFTILASLDFYASLTPQQKEIIDKATAYIVTYQRQKAKEMSDRALEAMKKAGLEVTVLDSNMKQTFREKMTPSYELVKERAGKIVDNFVKAADATR